LDLVQTWYGALVSVVGYRDNKYKIRPLHYSDEPLAALSLPSLALVMETSPFLLYVESVERAEYERVYEAICQLGPVGCDTQSVATMQALRRILFEK